MSTGMARPSRSSAATRPWLVRRSVDSRDGRVCLMISIIDASDSAFTHCERRASGILSFSPFGSPCVRASVRSPLGSRAAVSPAAPARQSPESPEELPRHRSKSSEAPPHHRSKRLSLMAADEPPAVRARRALVSEQRRYPTALPPAPPPPLTRPRPRREQTRCELSDNVAGARDAAAYVDGGALSLDAATWRVRRSRACVGRGRAWRFLPPFFLVVVGVEQIAPGPATPLIQCLGRVPVSIDL